MPTEQEIRTLLNQYDHEVIVIPRGVLLIMDKASDGLSLVPIWRDELDALATTSTTREQFLRNMGTLVNKPFAR
jgi:hypothetical protein